MENADEKDTDCEERPPKIKIFQLTQRNFALVGICPNLSLQSYPFNWKISMGIFILSLYIMCSMMYLFYTPNLFTENTQTVFMDSVAALIILTLLVLIFNVDEVFKYIEDCENIVNTSESCIVEFTVYKTRIVSSKPYFVNFLYFKNEALKYSASRSIFNEANRFERKLSEAIFLVMPQMTPVIAILPWTIYIYFIYFTTDSGNAAFELLLLMW